jgi:hypothetical protein
METTPPRVTIRVTRNRLLVALWVVVGFGTWFSLAGSLSTVERPTTTSYVVHVWKDASGAPYLVVNGGAIMRDGGNAAYPFTINYGYSRICPQLPNSDALCGIMSVGSQDSPIWFAYQETRTRPGTESIVQPTYGLPDLLVRSIFVATLLTVLVVVSWVALRWVRRNVRVVR